MKGILQAEDAVMQAEKAGIPQNKNESSLRLFVKIHLEGLGISGKQSTINLFFQQMNFFNLMKSLFDVDVKRFRKKEAKAPLTAFEKMPLFSDFFMIVRFGFGIQI